MAAVVGQRALLGRDRCMLGGTTIVHVLPQKLSARFTWMDPTAAASLLLVLVLPLLPWQSSRTCLHMISTILTRTLFLKYVHQLRVNPCSCVHSKVNAPGWVG